MPKKKPTSLLDLSTPEPDDSGFDYSPSGGFERRPLPNVQPLYEGGGSLTDIGPDPQHRRSMQAPAGMSFENQGISYTMPLFGGELEAQGMRRPLNAPRSSGPLEWGGMLNWRRPF